MSPIEQFQELVARQPRRVRTPSERDLRIYAAVRIEGRTQREVAAACGLVQPRISQIVRDVEAWRTPELAVPLVGPRAEVEDRLALARAEQAYQQAVRSFVQSRQPLLSVRSGAGRSGPWSVRTVTERTGDPRLLRAIQRATEELHELRRRAGERDPTAAWLVQMTQAIETLLVLRRQAEREGRVTSAGSPRAAVARFLNELIGGQADNPADENVKTAYTESGQNEAPGAGASVSSSGVTSYVPTTCAAPGESRPAADPVASGREKKTEINSSCPPAITRGDRAGGLER